MVAESPSVASSLSVAERPLVAKKSLGLERGIISIPMTRPQDAVGATTPGKEQKFAPKFAVPCSFRRNSLETVMADRRRARHRIFLASRFLFRRLINMRHAARVNDIYDNAISDIDDIIFRSA